nr:hypothetical protein Iba_chr14fCG11850 [Ipomoea batatas]
MADEAEWSRVQPGEQRHGAVREDPSEAQVVEARLAHFFPCLIGRNLLTGNIHQAADLGTAYGIKQDRRWISQNNMSMGSAGNSGADNDDVDIVATAVPRSTLAVDNGGCLHAVLLTPPSVSSEKQCIDIEAVDCSGRVFC